MSWERVTVGDLVTTKKGFAFKSNMYVESGVPIVRVSNFTEDSISDDDLKYYPEREKTNYTDFILRERDIIIQTVGSWQYNPASVVGKVVHVPASLDGALLNQNAVKLISNENVDRDFLYYRLRCDDFKGHVIGEARGAANQASITLDTIKSFSFDIPEYELQCKISAIIATYDNLIENNQKQIKLLEEAARRLYKEWFIDLRFPGYEDTAIVDGVPEGWERLPIGELIEKIPRTTQIMASEYRKEGLIPIIDQSKEFITGYTDNQSSLVNIGKPVIVFGDHTRILKYIQFPFAKGADGTQLIVSNRDKMPQSLFYCSLVGVDLSNYHYARHFKYLKAEEILVPTQEIADAFDRFASPIFTEVQRLRDIIKAAADARDRLLPKLMSDEIEI